MENNSLMSFDTLVVSMKEFLTHFTKSPELEKFLLTRFTGFIYANLINNFFLNLNKKVLGEFSLPHNKIKVIKNHFKVTLDETRSALKFQDSSVDSDYYEKFKLDVRIYFPQFTKIIIEVEKSFNIDQLRNYPYRFKNDIGATINLKSDLETKIITGIMESFIKQRKKLPKANKIGEMLRKVLSPKLLKISTQHILAEKGYMKSISESLKLQKAERNKFESRLYRRWRKPLDLMEILIGLSLAFGQEKKNKLSINGEVTNPKHSALIKIHARSLIMCNEIFSLIRTGFPDGAYARWRSLHELSVISFFLKQESDDISLRYFEHEAMRDFKEAEEYQKCCKRIGYKPYTKRQMDIFTTRYNNLLKKYGNEFKYGSGYEWIPKSIMMDRNFKTLERKVGFDHYRAYYNKSSNASHGGSAGFNYIGLMDRRQNRVLLAGATKYGFTDPLHATAISLLHITGNLLMVKPDFDSIIQAYILMDYEKRIGDEAIKIQKKMEEDAEE